jgi:hypothetical protein
MHHGAAGARADSGMENATGGWSYSGTCHEVFAVSELLTMQLIFEDLTHSRIEAERVAEGSRLSKEENEKLLQIRISRCACLGCSCRWLSPLVLPTSDPVSALVSLIRNDLPLREISRIERCFNLRQ